MEFFSEYYRAFRYLHFIGLLFWISGLYSWIKLAEMARDKDWQPAVQKDVSRVFRSAFVVGIYPGMLLILTGGTGMILGNPGLLSQPWLHAKFLLILLLICESFLMRWQTARGRISDSFSANFHHAVVGTLITLIPILAVVRPF